MVQAVVRETGQFQISKQLSFEAERHRLHKPKGLDTIRQHAEDFIAKREAPAFIAMMANRLL